MNKFKILQVFDNEYPPMAAIWCNMNNAEIVKTEDGKWKILSLDQELNKKLEAEEAEAKAKAEAEAARKSTKNKKIKTSK